MSLWLDTPAARHVWLVILTYFPLGLVGLWRWTVWLIKKGYGATYRPKTGSWEASVAVVTPVYNENPAVFRQALTSWQKNGVDEIVAVIDFTDEKCLAIFRDFSKDLPAAKLIVTKTPGKRPALVDGIQQSQSEIVALVDSDTIWAVDVKKNALVPFQDPKTGGVATRQSVLEPKTLAQRLFNAQLNLRYFEELPFMVGGGGTVITCISGRTAFYRRATVTPLLNDLLHETFWGKPVVSGDDKRLTYLVEAAGWKVAFQQNAQVFTPGMESLVTYLKQRLRWTRNSWRADLRTLTQRWVYKYPRFVWYLIDRILQPFAQLLSPITFLVSLALGLWIPAAVLFVWWHLGRLIRMWPHLKRQPQDIWLVPIFIGLNFYNSLMKIYALVTLNRQGWITRWDKSRLPGANRLRSFTAHAATAGVVVILAIAMTQFPASVLPSSSPVSAPHLLPAVGASDLDSPEMRHATYLIKPQDTLPHIAQRYNLTAEDIARANSGLASDLEPGTSIRLPLHQYQSLIIPARPTAQPTIRYSATDNTITVTGRGATVRLHDIQAAVSNKQLAETAPGEWLLKANLHVSRDVFLVLRSDEVTWLKLLSQPDQFVWLRTYDGRIAIDGVKITSWNQPANMPDEAWQDGRSYILAKKDARLDIYGSELAYLGYYPPAESGGNYGVSWRTSDDPAGRWLITGSVRNSRFHHNYFGAYTFGASHMIWQDNELDHNLAYGLDPHDFSNYFLIENNRTHHNGKHGIILAANCRFNTVRRNISYDNAGHGIMLHEYSDHNTLADNMVHHNTDGIALYQSSANLVIRNRSYLNQQGIRINQSSNNNFISFNEVKDNQRYGIHIYGASPGNLLADNIFRSNAKTDVKTE